MATASLAHGVSANQGGAISCTASAVSCTISSVIRSLIPNKTWVFISDSFDLQERAAKHRLAGTRPYTVEELQILLQSEDGIDFLVAIMGDAQPTWWRWMTKVMTLAAVRRRQAEDQQEILKLETSNDVEVGARRRIKGALNADRNLSAAIARAETAVGFQRPERGGAVAHGSSAGARISDRAVATAGRRRG
ncbi:MAG: hypothetical protein JWM36_1854 [Hyphomicrobiales bacterium]|nr:hypothetical protein [Hyphomicrobiales bacterium]